MVSERSLEAQKWRNINGNDNLLNAFYFESESVSHSVMPDSLWPFCPWNSGGKITGVGCHFLLQGELPNARVKPTSPALENEVSTIGPTREVPILYLLNFISITIHFCYLSKMIGQWDVILKDFLLWPKNWLLSILKESGAMTASLDWVYGNTMKCGCY